MSKEVTFELELEGLVRVAVGRGKRAFLAEGRAWTKGGKQPRMVAPAFSSLQVVFY